MMKIAKRSHAASGLFFDASLGALACLTAACSLNVSGGDKTPDTFPIEGAPSGPNYLPDAATIEEDTAIIPIIPVPDASTSEPPPGGADAGPGGPAPSACEQGAQQWLAIARANCAACHGSNSPARAGFSTVLDVPALIAGGKIKPGDPDASPLYLKLSSGQMPPAGRTPRPSEADIASVRAWIACGAPAPAEPRCQARCTTFVDIDSRIQLMLKDVLAMATAEERADTRYLDLSNYANAGHGDAELDLYRGAISYLVNSLSNGPKIVVPQAIDPQGLLFRIRLSDYGWSASSWEVLAAAYPYAVRYQVDSRKFRHDEPQADALRERTGTATPYVQADWFFSHASRPPLYYALLGVPATLAELQTQLGVNIQANITALRATRAGFADSDLSKFNRVIERHSLGDARGALWLTYDFSAGSGTSNVLTHPLDFVSDSSEILWNLPNGLQAYLITDGQGRRLDKAPNGAVQDPRSQDLAIESGISCVSCHTDDGIFPHADEVRARTPLSTTDLDALARVLGLYVEKPALDGLFAADQGRYRTARAATRPRSFVSGSAHVLNDAYRGLLKLSDVAGVLGVDEGALLAAVDETPLVFPSEITGLRNGNASLARDTFDSLFVQLVSSLGLGQAQR